MYLLDEMFLKDKLTIIIPSYNEEKYIRRTLISIINQVGISNVRIIAADNHSTDGTREVIEKFNKDFYKNVEIIDGGKVAYARNRAAELVKTEYILFIDADEILYNEYNIIENMSDMVRLNLDLLTIKVKSYGDDIRTKMIFKLFNMINVIMSNWIPFAVGGYFLTRTDKFREFGGFDETVTNSEDFLLSRKYSPNKFKISRHYAGQDDRRFKKMGYFGMIRLLYRGYVNRNNIEYFRKDVGYWD
jgi:glycosyltransferase involved in cell wall biosynthesis